MIPDLKSRTSGTELMDDPSVPVDDLQRALRDLPRLNRLLGGYHATESVLRRHVRSDRPKSLRILDLGTGIGDYPRRLVRWGDRNAVHITVVGIDASETAIQLAKQETSKRLPRELAQRITFLVGDATRFDTDADSFDICTAALFFHHLPTEQIVSLLTRMNHASRIGIVINDIHRCLPAYFGISVLTRLLRYSSMVRHDGPVSVQRAFARQELTEFAHLAGIKSFRVEWHWAFRWILTNVPTDQANAI